LSFRVRIVGDTVHPQVRTSRITTFEIYDPRIILAEWNTHGLLAKSAQSSRAVPVKTRIKAVESDPYIPEYFGKNIPGMHDDGPLSTEESAEALKIWNDAIADALRHAGRLAEVGLHKQFANRVIETYAHCYHVVTATEWDNFFRLRNHEYAQPEFKQVAEAMHAALKVAVPRVSIRHLPYIEDALFNDPKAHGVYDGELHLISGARCARVSYTSHDGQDFSAEKDKELCQMLIREGHMSPFDHPSMADSLVSNTKFEASWAQPRAHGRFWGWIPVRTTIEAAYGRPPTRRDSFKVLELEDFV
jgi:thymidylate synthase ThyX